jgi:hypothetical protein
LLWPSVAVREPFKTPDIKDIGAACQTSRH